LVAIGAFLGGLATGCEAPAVPGEAERTTSAPIIGGAADSGDPAIVAVFSLANDGRYGMCTGEIVSAHFVLTASHCVEPTMLGFTPDRVVVVTYPDALHAPSANVLDVKKATQHPAYIPNIGQHDVAVLELVNATDIPPLPFNHQALPASVVGQTARAVGYGLTNGADKNSAGTKNQVSLPISELTATSFLVFSPGKTQCHGDSGGPVLLPIGDQETIIGVGWRTVKDDGTCDDGVLDTRVDPNAGWIDSVLLNDNPPAPAPAPPPDNDALDTCIAACHTVACIQACANGP
jgi:secreted trypsin-like serine protease